MIALQSMWSRICLVGLLCVASSFAGARQHPDRATEQGEPGQFDYYLLSLSWSPSYCLTHPGDRRQCVGKGYGFVLHGLWPQFESGGYPENCAADAALTPDAEAVGRTLYPSPSLMQHEWQLHGTCSGLSAADYFRIADRALGAVRIPTPFEAPPVALSMTGAQIAANFRAANAGMPEDGLTVACSHGQLSEVRVCLSRDLAIRSCGRRVRSSCPSAAVQVPSSR
jgi:ribonuclease T2